MILENEKYRVEITIDETYTIDSADNRYYDVILNPCRYKKSDELSKTFSIHVNSFGRELYIALIGPYHIFDEDCAVLENEMLTVLQDNTITQIHLVDGSIIRHIRFDCFGCNFSIYKVENGYIVYGEIDITVLDLDFVKKWDFSGRDIFVSITGKQSFEIRNNMICLYDFEDNYYEVDFNGKCLRYLRNEKKDS